MLQIAYYSLLFNSRLIEVPQLLLIEKIWKYHLLLLSEFLQKISQGLHILRKACDTVRVKRMNPGTSQIHRHNFVSPFFQQCNSFIPAPGAKTTTMNKYKVVGLYIIKLDILAIRKLNK